MIVITGAAGFIGSNIIRKLNKHNFNNLIAVDKFDKTEKLQNLKGVEITEKIDREVFFEWLDQNYEEVEFIFHLGARTDTTETDEQLLKSLNTDYSKKIWTACSDFQIPLIYASSAATYGDGSHGFSDDESKISNLSPLNAYGWSKQNFDLWALSQSQKPFFWAGLKFFNVYGPNEGHKGRMASVAYHASRQIKKTRKMKLFKSHIDEVRDGEQKRDFVYVGDVTDILYWMMHQRKNSGIYNIGTGSAQTFNQLAKAIFNGLTIPENIEYIEIPEDIRNNYQYYTEADISKLRKTGYKKEFTGLQAGINKYLSLDDDFVPGD